MPVVPLQHTSTATVEMRPAPIDPQWVVEGSPMARVGALSRSADGLSWTDVWDCTAGRFVWRYDVDETVHILQGGAHVVDANGTHWELRPGDVVSFRVGTQAQWHVPHYVRKVAFCSEVVPKPLTALINVERRLRGRTRPLAAAAAGLVAMTMAAGVMMAE
jgi:uncharacterized cupin superfamily protein